jgi:hypothetical protein
MSRAKRITTRLMGARAERQYTEKMEILANSPPILHRPHVEGFLLSPVISETF